MNAIRESTEGKEEHRKMLNRLETIGMTSADKNGPAVNDSQQTTLGRRTEFSHNSFNSLTSSRKFNTNSIDSLEI